MPSCSSSMKSSGRLYRITAMRGIDLGDIPIYCAMDSADVWGNRKMFDFSWKGRNIEEESSCDAEAKGYPGFVAGVPPGCFLGNRPALGESSL